MAKKEADLGVRVGDVVLVRLKDQNHNFGKPGGEGTVLRPAIVRRVWSEDCVNLTIFGDGGCPHPFKDSTPTSVSRGSEPGQWRPR